MEVDVLEDLEGLVVVAQQRVQTQQSNQTEVTQHLVQRVLAKLSRNAVGVTCQNLKKSNIPIFSLLYFISNSHKG